MVAISQRAHMDMPQPEQCQVAILWGAMGSQKANYVVFVTKTEQRVYKLQFCSSDTILFLRRVTGPSVKRLYGCTLPVQQSYYVV